MKRTIGIAALAALAALLLGISHAGAARAADPTEPPGFTSHSYRLDVNLEDVSGSLFSATLSDIPSTVPTPAAQWIGYNLDAGTFDLESSHAKCFIVSGSASSVPCSKIADMVDTSADGGVDATILAEPTDDNAQSFDAKKITVWVDAGGNDVAPPVDGGTSGTDQTATVPPPAKFYTKNIRLNVNLQDVDQLLFDVTVNDIPSTVPNSFRAYLQTVLDGSTFELDASAASCFVVKHNVANAVSCQAIASWLDASPDGGIDATILAKAVPGPELAYKAKKITVWQ